MREFASKTVAAIRFVPIVLQLYVIWNAKAVVREALRIGAYYYLSLSVLAVVADVAVEYFGPVGIAQAIHNKPEYEIYLLTGTVIAALILLVHHHHERARVDTEYRLAESLWYFLVNRGSLDEGELIQVALEKIHEAFARLSAAYVWFWSLDGDKLRVPPGCVYPNNSEPERLRELALGEGLAGVVFQDGKTAYAPRLRWPSNRLRALSVPFLHALVFDISRDARSGRVALVHNEVMPNVIKRSTSDYEPFRALIAVPLRPQPAVGSLGVLCIDFSKTDPLGVNQVKMAVSFAMLFADELNRCRASMAALGRG